MNKRTINYAALSKECGIPAKIIRERHVRYHWGMKQAMTVPNKKKRRNSNNQFDKQGLDPYGVEWKVPLIPQIYTHMVGPWL